MVDRLGCPAKRGFTSKEHKTYLFFVIIYFVPSPPNMISTWPAQRVFRRRRRYNTFLNKKETYDVTPRRCCQHRLPENVSNALYRGTRWTISSKNIGIQRARKTIKTFRATRRGTDEWGLIFVRVFLYELQYATWENRLCNRSSLIVRYKCSYICETEIPRCGRIKNGRCQAATEKTIRNVE